MGNILYGNENTQSNLTVYKESILKITEEFNSIVRPYMNQYSKVVDDCIDYELIQTSIDLKVTINPAEIIEKIFCNLHIGAALNVAKKVALNICKDRLSLIIHGNVSHIEEKLVRFVKYEGKTYVVALYISFSQKELDINTGSTKKMLASCYFKYLEINNTESVNLIPL